MTITKIKRIGSTNRFHVYIDDEWAGVFLDEILVKYQFKMGTSVQEDEYKTIKAENDEKVAFDMAVGYVERYVVSEKGMRDYLKKKGFDFETISKTMDKLREYGMIDDEKFARNYFESISSGKGKRAIAQKLRAKGVSKDIVDALIENIEEESEFENAKILAEKFVKNRQKDAKNKQKCLAHLIYKGYDYSVAQRATNEVFENIGENNDWF